MTVKTFGAQGVTTLFEQPEPDRARLEPGDHLASHPDAPPRGDTRAARAEEAAHDRLIVLSEALSTSQLAADTPYVLRDEYGRVLCVENSGVNTWQWAYVGPYDSYPNDVLPLHFSADPTTGGQLIAQATQPWPLHSNGKATSWEWTFWAASTYSPNGDYPTMKLKAHPVQTAPNQPDKVSLSWDNAGTTMYLCADTGTWNWLYVSSTHTRSDFTIHKFYVKKAKVSALFQQTWPGASFVYSAFNTGDEYYEAITDPQAKSIYGHSGLSGFSYVPEVFDCDDYSYVYKAQASKDAWSSRPEFGYAVGVLFGANANGAHAVNVFIDPKGGVRVLEPQNGSIVAGADWKDAQGVAYQPYFVLM
ncbi:MAG: lectin MOA-related protein [Acidobacteria bacterium]|nr:lectin MOA-related protein [Acidobacteriota bacterium]